MTKRVIHFLGNVDANLLMTKINAYPDLIYLCIDCKNDEHINLANLVKFYHYVNH